MFRIFFRKLSPGKDSLSFQCAAFQKSRCRPASPEEGRLSRVTLTRSGLLFYNNVTASILVRVLQELYKAPELRTDFICILALGGVDGTLRRRFLSEKHMGRIMAKTGSLANVSSLSGFAFSETRGPLAFSVITNGIGRQYRADHVENEIARALLDY